MIAKTKEQYFKTQKAKSTAPTTRALADGPMPPGWNNAFFRVFEDFGPSAANGGYVGFIPQARKEPTPRVENDGGSGGGAGGGSDDASDPTSRKSQRERLKREAALAAHGRRNTAPDASVVTGDAELRKHYVASKRREAAINIHQNVMKQHEMKISHLELLLKLADTDEERVQARTLLRAALLQDVPSYESPTKLRRVSTSPNPDYPDTGDGSDDDGNNGGATST